MIIRTSPRRSYTALPNAIFRDRRYSLDTRAALAYLLTLPPSWDIRPSNVARALSPEKGRQIGKHRLRRIFSEMQTVGHMARSQSQTREGDGYFGSYVYVVGPDPDEVRREAASLGVAFLPQFDLRSTDDRSTDDRSTADQPTTKTIKENNKSSSQTPTNPPSRRASPEVGVGVAFAEFKNAYPFEAWMSPSAAERLWRKLTDIEQGEAVVAAEMYAADCKAKGRKVQNAKTWLSERAWEGYIGRVNGATHPVLKPHSDEWRAERERRLSNGQDVSWMDSQAAIGKGWSVPSRRVDDKTGRCCAQ